VEEGEKLLHRSKPLAFARVDFFHAPLELTADRLGFLSEAKDEGSFHGRCNSRLVERPSRALSVFFWWNQARDPGFPCLGGIGGCLFVSKYPADRGRGKKNVAKRLVGRHGIRQLHNRCAAELTMLFRGLLVFHALV
jgi:hypothetical protein